MPESAVKDVLAELVSDGLVQKEKIGTTNYFWALRSSAALDRQRRVTKLECETKVLDEQAMLIRHEIEGERILRGVNSDRAAQLEKVSALSTRHALLELELADMMLKDPEQMENKLFWKQREADAANRYLDNILLLQSCFKEHHGGSSTADIDFLQAFNNGEPLLSLD
ncbi:Meiotic nuclear division protein 1 [Savitreella phatthalungensis]